MDATYRFERAASSRVVTGRGARASIADLASGFEPDGVAIVFDRAVAGFANEVADAIGARIRLPVVGGEDAKRLTSLGALSQALLDARATRRTLLVGMGGGTVTDLVGLVGAVHLRGLVTALLPTTTLAMCDAALGGKNGVDLGGLKNVIGTVRQPAFVVADTDWLATLPEAYFVEGLAEVVKAAAVLDASAFERLEAIAEDVVARDGAALDEVVELATELKMRVVVGDETESDRRRWLNFGHTIGHALESLGGLGARSGALRHGPAVALGMVAECRATEDVPADVTGRIAALLERLGLATDVPPELAASSDADLDRLWSWCQQDKKAHAGTVPTIVPERIGSGAVRPLTRASLARGLGSER